MAQVEVRLFAAAAAAAGCKQTSAPASDLAALRSWLTSEFGDDLGRVLGASSFLVDGVATRDQHVPLTDGATVDVLPPFAGG